MHNFRLFLFIHVYQTDVVYLILKLFIAFTYRIHQQDLMWRYNSIKVKHAHVPCIHPKKTSFVHELDGFIMIYANILNRHFVNYNIADVKIENPTTFFWYFLMFTLAFYTNFVKIMFYKNTNLGASL